MSQPTSSPQSRRSFLQTGAGAVAGLVAARLPIGATPTPRQRLAVVGTGIRGITLWGRTLQRDYSDAVELVGLCDTNPGRLAFASQFIGAGCPTYTDFGRMLVEARPQRVVVTTVDNSHAALIVQALDAGCHVITEKPLTTDETGVQAILDAVARHDRDIVVAHNYRYAPHRLRIKEILRSGRIGEVTSADFHWYLDTSHGAAYFRRWHGKERFSGTLFVHKACHHFDLLGWWLESEPEVVYAQGALRHYGGNNSFRSTRCRGCAHAERCDYFWDISKSPLMVQLYADHEHHDGYIRDGCVWSEEIDIFDQMAAQIAFANGVQVSYSCTTYSPYEGYRIAFNGTRGRLEAWIFESQPWGVPDYDELRLTDNFGASELIRIPHDDGGHGGGDPKMLDRILREPDGPDPLRQAAGSRQGAMAVLLGIGARKSARSGQPVRIADLSSLSPRATWA
ncbi:MAG TPA: Gfo/Idh/MocA family oxidoreductase [Thermoanaerobaculia bacterium]|nr:Gfo/Idh/MocA family oxidoreductase [Thermoanaerobaculia bacterium]